MVACCKHDLIIDAAPSAIIIAVAIEEECAWESR